MSGELVRARQAQTRFLESVSHELRTPLTSIRGYAEALEEQAIEPEEAARVIGSEAGRLERLVADLLELARVGRADFTVAHDPIDLAEVVRHAVERHLPQARELTVELTGSAAPDSLVVGDEDRILQAVSNLVENALRVTPAGGSVTVSARAGEIAVRDTGPGLEAQDIPRAFERFYLHTRYRSERPVGSGLGLAIVAELVAAMGGTVEAAVPEDGGAKFTIRLPTTTARPARPDAVRPYA
jgi:two-component system, OmpR family, sensor kinase